MASEPVVTSPADALPPDLAEVTEHLVNADMAAATATGDSQSDALQRAVAEAVRVSTAALEVAQARLTEAENEYRATMTRTSSSNPYDSAFIPRVSRASRASASASGSGKSAGDGPSSMSEAERKQAAESTAATRLAAASRGHASRKQVAALREEEKAKPQEPPTPVVKSQKQIEAEQQQAAAREKLEAAQAAVQEAAERLAKIQKQQMALTNHRMSVTDDEWTKIQSMLAVKADKEARERRRREESEAARQAAEARREAEKERLRLLREEEAAAAAQEKRGVLESVAAGVLGNGLEMAKGLVTTRERKKERAALGATSAEAPKPQGGRKQSILGAAVGAGAALLSNRAAPGRKASVAEEEEDGLSALPGLRPAPPMPQTSKRGRMGSVQMGNMLGGLLSSRNAPGRDSSRNSGSTSHRGAKPAALQKKPSTAFKDLEA